MVNAILFPRLVVAGRLVAVMLLSFLGLTSQAGADDAKPVQRYRLMVINADGTGLRPMPGDDRQTYGSPDWSPDGEWIAYDTWSVGERLVSARVEIMRADGSEVRQLGVGAMPSWSPDGKQLVAHTYDGPGTIFVMNADGSGRTAIMPHWGSPRWSPVGHRIVAANSSGGLSLYDLAAGEEHRLLADRSVYQGLSISPDGRRICFADRVGALAVATIGEQTSHATARNLVEGGYFSHSSWSPDGKRIVFTWKPKRGEDVEHLYIIDADGDQLPKKLTGLGETAASDPDWSPDGKQILFRQQVAAESFATASLTGARKENVEARKGQVREQFLREIRQLAGKMVSLRSDLDELVWNDVKPRWTTTEAAKLLIAFFRGDGRLPGFTGTSAEARQLQSGLAHLRETRALTLTLFSQVVRFDAMKPESPLCGMWEVTGVGGAGGVAADALELYDPDPVGRKFAVANGAALLVTGGGAWLFDATYPDEDEDAEDEDAIDLSAVVRGDTVYRGRYEVDGQQATLRCSPMNSPRPTGDDDHPTDGGFVLHLKRIDPK